MSRVAIAVILSFICPGLGQFYNREPSKGWTITGITLILIVLPTVWLIRQISPAVQTADPMEIQDLLVKIVLENKHFLNLITFSFLGLWAYSITQAYFKAKEILEKEPSESS